MQYLALTKKMKVIKRKLANVDIVQYTLYILDSKAQDRICSQRLISSWVHTLPVCRYVCLCLCIFFIFILTSYSSSGGRRSQLSYVSHVINQSRQQLNFDLFTKLSAWLPDCRLLASLPGLSRCSFTSLFRQCQRSLNLLCRRAREVAHKSNSELGILTT